MNYPHLCCLRARKIVFLCLLILTASSVFGQNFESSASCTSPGFIAGKAVSLGGTTSFIAAADFNNDGKRDIAANIFNISTGSGVEIKLGDGNGSFTTAATVGTPSFINGLTTADFNADGNTDLLVIQRPNAQSAVLIFTGDGTGNFLKTRTIEYDGELATSLAGDFNGDDRTDFAVADAVQNKILIYYGDNAGNFSPGENFTVGAVPVSIAKADFNNDGRTDLIVANSNSSFVSVLLAAPSGKLNIPVSVPITNYTNAGFVAVGDINNDGKADAVAASIDANSSGASVLIGNGAGGFTLQPFLASAAGTSKISLADMNSDGKLDIVSTAGNGNGGQGLPAIRLGKGDGTFGDELTYISAGFVTSQAIDDFNGDGKADLAQTAGSAAEFHLFFGAGNGRFGAPTVSVGGQPISTAAADFNGDGKPDLAVSDFDGWKISILTNDGSGNFAVTKTIPLSQRPSAIFSADFNKDGKPDLGTLNWYTQTGAGGYSIILNTGSDFSAPVVHYSGSNTFRFLLASAVGDVTGDGILDIAIGAGDSPGLLTIQKGNGDGTFTFLRSMNVGQGGNVFTPNGVAIGDFNRDGKNDIAVTAAGSVLVYTNNGAGSFSSPTFFQVTNSPVARIAVADFNHDGILDAAVTNNDQNAASFGYVPSLSILLGNGTGGFLAATTYQTGRGTSSIAVADFNNDTHLDIVVANGLHSAYPDNRAGILYGDGKGAFSAVQRYVSGMNSFDISVADFNADGRLDIATPNFRGENVSILLNTCLPDAPTGFPALAISQDLTLAETDAGTINATFTVSLSAPSSRQVRVDYYTTAGTAAGFADYRPAAGTLVFQPNEVSKTIVIPINGDTIDEFNESFSVFLANPLNASLGDAKATVTIVEDDDPTPTVSIGNLTVSEGSSGTVAAVFPISLSQASGKPISVQFTAAPGTASAGVDFVSVSGTLNIPAGSLSAIISVTINSDTLVEPDETFFINLSNPVNTAFGRAQAIGTIVNDDFGGNVQFGSGGAFNVAENAGSATVTVTRANGNASGVVVQYATSNGSAVAGQDYTATSGSVTFGANEVSKTFTVPIINDSLDEEPIESISLSLTNATGGATLGIPTNAVLNIADDDPLPKIRIGNVSITEGNQGFTTATVTVDLLAASGRTVDVNFATANGTATSPSDYQAVSGVLKFAPGETSKTISVVIIGDTTNESDETFQITLSNPINSTFENSIATVTINNDDSRKHSPADFDGDGKSDVAVFRPNNGVWYQLNSTSGFAAAQFGISTDKIAPADFDGDGKTDLAVFRDGNWFLMKSREGFASIPFGSPGDIPEPADFDGDGRAELVVFRPSNGVWYSLNLVGNAFSAVQFGASEDKPVTADYDGDGKADQAVYRPSNGVWYMLRSRDGFLAVQFGIATDKPVVGDFDGDGRADQAVYRAQSGTWYILGTTRGFTSMQFGLSTDIPAPGDYDGDGKTDIAVFRPESGNWYQMKSIQGFAAVQFGAAGDKPIPSSLVP